MKTGLKGIMQQIFNACPILDHKDSQNIKEKFEMIGPINIDEVLKKTDFNISFDENLYEIGFI